MAPAIHSVEHEPPFEGEKEVQEPLLKYERVGGYFHAIFKDDSLSCIALHVNYMCVGTYAGNVLLLELDGKFIRRLHQHYKKVNQVCIDETGQYIASCSDDGTVAVYNVLPATTSKNTSGESDIPISVSSTGGEVNIYNYFSAVYTVQLEDRYAMKRDKSFACGGIAGQLIINKKGWIIDKENTVHEGEGPVQCIRWKEGLVAWANDWGVKVYDADRDQRITYIERPPNCPPMELCRCHLEWQSSSVLLVGWAHTLRVISFRKSDTTRSPGTDILPGMVTAEVTALISFDFFVAGLTPWGTTAVCVLAFRPPGSGPTGVSKGSNKSEERFVEGEGESGEIPLPEVHVVGLNGKQVAADILNLKGYYRLRASDYKMPSLQYTSRNTADSSSIYAAGYGRLSYICTPKDAVICRLRDVDDRVAWAISRKQYERALELAIKGRRELRKHVLEELMEYYLGELLKKKEFKKAAEEIKRLFVGDETASLWEKYVYVFAQKGQLNYIAKYIPTASPRLPRTQYEMVLKHFLDSDPQQLLEIIRKWPKPRHQDLNSTQSERKNAQPSPSKMTIAPEYTETSFVFEPLYDPESWINQLEAVVRRRRIAETEGNISVETSYLMEALAELYTATEQYEHALRIYLSQGSFCTNKDHAFKLITEHSLWSLVQNKVLNLMQIDRSSAIRMLVNQVDNVKILDVVKQLDNDRMLLHEYLHDLFLHRPKDYNNELYALLHQRQVELYSEFAPHQLVKFLQSSNFVPLEQALSFCSNHSPPLHEAMIYILGKMGHHTRALELILTQIRDITKAIEFIQECGVNEQPQLWEYLIDLSLTSKDNVEELLKCAALHKIDPIKLLKKIPDDMEIEELKQKMTEILRNYKLQLRLCHGCNKVFENDRVQLLKQQVVLRKKGRRVTQKKQCCICYGYLKALPSASTTTSLADTNRSCVFECGHVYHLPCLEEKTRLWKRSDINDIVKTLGCFVCDHTTREYARSGAHAESIAVKESPPRGITEDQLQRAKDNIGMLY